MSMGRVRDKDQNRSAISTHGNEEVVEVAEQLKKFVIGKNGRTINRIKEMSGAAIYNRPDDGFLLRGSDRQRQCAKEQISQIVQQTMSAGRVREENQDRNGEVVKVAEQLKKFVIGKNGSTINRIKEMSGAAIDNHPGGGFLVRGSDRQRQCAKEQISQIVTTKQHEHDQDQEEMLDMVPEHLKGLVIGRGRQTLNEISTRTGARLRVKADGNIYMAGSEKNKEKARYEVRSILAASRAVNPNQRKMFCCFVDGFRLPQDCELNLVPSTSADGHPRYRLRMSEDSLENSDVPSTSTTNGSPSYMEELMDHVNKCLVELKEGIDSGHVCNNIMWCHFGKVFIYNVDEEDAHKGWTLDEAAQNLECPFEAEGRDDQHPLWRTKLTEGVTFDVERRLGEHLDRPVYSTRHDINFLTPSGIQVRCKVWIRQNNCTDTGGDCDEIPFNDIKNILGEVVFKNEQTKARCKGWLCRSSQHKLKADIIFPACEFDCRLTLRTSNMFAKTQSPIEETENKILLEYFSYLELDGENLVLPDKLPSNFHVDYQRCCRRASYRDGEEFTIIVSRETTLPSGEESTDLHLHCNKWDQLLRSTQWKPEEVMENFPSFLNFVSKVQQLILDDQEDQASSEN